MSSEHPQIGSPSPGADDRAGLQPSPPPTPTASHNPQDQADKGEGPSSLTSRQAPRRSSLSGTGTSMPIQALSGNGPVSSSITSMRLPKGNLGSLAPHPVLYPPPNPPGERARHARRRTTRSARRREDHLPVLRGISEASARISAWVERSFRKHGANVSRHPIRTLLLCCLLITSLFYPAAGIYLWSSQGGPGISRSDTSSVWRTLSTPLLDSFASSGRTHHNSLRDLRMVWDDASDLYAQDPRDWMPERHKTRPPRCARLEHVLFTTDDVMRGEAGRRGVLEVPVLNSAYRLQSALEAQLNSAAHDGAQPRCVQDAKGACLTLGPLDYWPDGSFPLDVDVEATAELLAPSVNRSTRGVPVSLETTLAGRAHMFARNPRAEFLAFSFWLEQPHCNNAGDDEHVKFRALLSEIAIGTRIVESEHQAAKAVLVRFAPDKRTPRAHQIMLALGYLGFLLYIGRGLVRMRKVHSRFGLAFTGFTELLISMIMSVSICALCGVRLTAVPWEILPFVIVVVGSENMFVLANAIVSTPISLSVASRVAAGLGAAGVSIAVTVLSDVLLLSAIAMLVHVAAVREFCIFAICSLIVDFVMQMTFFVTVFSIDLQRLELADLLAQGGRSLDQDTTTNELSEANPSAAPPVPASSRGAARKADQRSGSFIKMSCRAVWRARTARTASLSILMAAMFGLYLYYGTGYQSQDLYGPSLPFSDLHGLSASIPSRSSQARVAQASNVNSKLEPAEGTPDSFDPLGHLSPAESSSTALSPWWMDSPSALFWMALNPEGAPHVRVAVEPWSIVSLRSAKGATPQHTRKLPFASWALFRPRMRAIIWFLKLSVLPIGGTTGLLWILLLYLLKDTELLDAQRGKGSISEDEEGNGDTSGFSAKACSDDLMDVNLTLLTGIHPTDVVLTEADGSLVASVAMDSSIAIWDNGGASRKLQLHWVPIWKIGGTDTTSVTCIELSASNGLLAIGQRSGYVTLYSFVSQQVTQRWQPTTALTQSTVLSRNGLRELCVTSIHRDGSVWTWVDSPAPTCDMCVKARSDLSWAVHRLGGDSKHFALSAPRHPVEVYRVAAGSATLISLVANTAAHVVRSLAALGPDPGEDSANIVAESAPLSVREPVENLDVILIGTSTGSVQATRVMDGEVLGQVALSDGPVVNLLCIPETRRRHQPFAFFVAVTQTRVTLLRLVRESLPSSSRQAYPSPLSPSRSSPTNFYTRTASEASVVSELSEGHANSPSPMSRESFEAGQRSHIDTAAQSGALIAVMSLRCHRGSAAILASHGEASRLIGVRRRPRADGAKGDIEDNRAGWELWELDLRDTIVSESLPQSWKVRTCPVDLDAIVAGAPRSASATDSDSDDASAERRPRNYLTSARRHGVNDHVAARGPHAPLSFSRVSLIQGLEKGKHLSGKAAEENFMQALTDVEEQSSSLVLAFGNSLARASVALQPHAPAGASGSVSSATAFALHPSYDQSSALMRRRRSRFE